MSASPSIGFVIPVRNDATRLRRCLESIVRSAGNEPIQIVVADNGSEDASAEVAERAGAKVLSIPRRSVGELRNAAAAHVTAPLVAFVDADHLIDPGWTAAAIDIFRDPQISAAGAPYSAADDANWVQRAYARFRPVVNTVGPTEWLGSGNLAVRRDAFERVNGFDTELEACEDVDLCNRLRASGCRLLADPRLRSVHLGDPATLRAVFFGELWRGRNNLKVTLRGPITPRALPSLVIPIVDLMCLATIVASPFTGVVAALLAAAMFAAFTGLRAIRMTRSRPPAGFAPFVQSLIVAGTYDLARALALVFRATHRTRRESAGERALA
jgi:GT2 family glycosyltransferase